jgi:hypothetical protein
MTDPITTAIAGAILAFTIINLLRLLRSCFGPRVPVPDITGSWSCRWYDDDKSPEIGPIVEDILIISPCGASGLFTAAGIQPQNKLEYPLLGEVDASRIVTLSYKAARYPYEPNRGVIILELSRDGKKMEGRWLGRRYSGHIGGGKVICVR